MTANPEVIFSRYAKELETETRAIVPEDPAGLFGMVKYHLGWVDQELRPAQTKAGKSLRPVLCLLSCEATGGRYEDALAAAVSLELLHNFSLVHDDVQDSSLERRHRPAVWAIWGVGQAINVGDALFSLAHVSLYRIQQHGMNAALVLEAIRRMEETALALCGGQYLDLAFEQRSEVSEDEYFTMVRGKTAALLGFSAELGALIGGRDAELAKAYRRFGESLGVAFQVQDDVLGIWGDPKVTGKPAADDVRSRKKTLPIIHAFQSLPRDVGLRLRELYSQSGMSEVEVAQVIDILNGYGVREYSEQGARRWYEQALRELDEARPSVGPREELAAVADFLMGRAY